jgi:hypothetical protein
MPEDYKDRISGQIHDISLPSGCDNITHLSRNLSKGKYCLRYQKSPLLNFDTDGGNRGSRDSVAESYRESNRIVSRLLFDSFFTSLDEFVQLAWTGICTSRTSRISVLPSVGAVATAVVPSSWATRGNPEGYIVCRDFSGKWTMVNTEWIKDVKASSDSAPCKLLSFINKVNVSITRHTSFLVFDENGVGFVLEHDFINDKLFVYSYDADNDRLVSLASISDLPPGAVNIHHIRNMRVVLSTGCCYHEYDIVNAAESGGKSIPSIATGTSGGEGSCLPSSQLLPVSTQLVVPLSSNGYVYLSRGSVWLASTNSDALTLPKCIIDSTQCGIHYVSVTAGENTILLFGYDDTSSKYITMIDQSGLFVISTKKIELNLPLSIVSVHIDPITLDTIILGRSGCINGGSIVLSIPPLFD